MPKPKITTKGKNKFKLEIELTAEDVLYLMKSLINFNFQQRSPIVEELYAKILTARDKNKELLKQHSRE